MSRAAGLPGSVRSKRSGANDFQPPQPCSSRLGTFRLHLLSEHGCQPLAPSESKYLRLVADNASYANWPKNAEWVVNKNVLGAGDFKPSGRSRYARTESLIELANLLPHAARHHHAKPVQHLRPRQFPAASSVVAAGSDSHLLDMLGIGGKDVLSTNEVTGPIGPKLRMAAGRMSPADRPHRTSAFAGLLRSKVP
jgi:hypothetical protein